MNEKSEQIDARLNILIDNDQPLSPEGLERSVICSLKGCQDGTVCLCVEKSGEQKHKYISFESESKGMHAFLTAAVTFLGGNGNHPIFKKRIQLKQWYKPMYYVLRKAGYMPHFLGVYHYNGNIIFVDFMPDTYLHRKMHNSSAFVYVNDLFRAMKDGVAVREDLHGNIIKTIRFDKLLEFLSKDSVKNSSDALLIERFMQFNREMPFNQWLKASSAISEMHDANWSKWRETEWAGWFLEYRFCTFLKRNNIKEIIYYANSGKRKDLLDFDLLFPLQKFYGDLKASDSKERTSPGNDQKNLTNAINRYDRFWYIIYEHDTIKDRDKGNEMTQFRYKYLISLDDKTAKSPLSYATRMKHSVNFRRMMILELNRANCGEILSVFNQGRQPDGKTRAVKFLINKRNVENYQVFHYEV